MESDTPTLLFIIDDSETHWVAAKSFEQALEIFFEPLGGREGYIKEVGDEMPEIAVYTRPLRIILDEDPAKYGFPRGCQILVSIPTSKFAELPIGLVATTAY